MCEQVVRRFGLDLRGLTVLTEAGSRHFRLTPLVAEFAGAERVLARVADSRYGTAAEVREATRRLAQAWGLERLEFVERRDDPRVGEADIVTNLGFVRPIDRTMVARLKPTAVVPLMWETWEYRPEDLDLAACRAREIPVLGTNEHHPDLRTLEFVGLLALKLLLQADVEVLRARVVVLGGGEFGRHTRRALRRTGARVLQLPASSPAGEVLDAVRDADALVVVEHRRREPLIGPGSRLSGSALAAANPGLVVAHVCGGVDRAALAAAGLRTIPERFAPAGYMSVAIDYLGARPIMELHAAGLRVGAELARERPRHRTALATELEVLRRCPLAQGFAGYHDPGPGGAHAPGHSTPPERKP